MSARIAWDKGGEATVVSLEVHGTTDGVRLVSTTPAPPGARVDGSFTDEGGTKHTVRIKVHGSKRRDDGAFDVEGRLLDLRKETRELLARL